ncbi:SDR family NAD(P)-dependent oxidoreductase [Quadrisphaera setariae]|uniref:SDR family NAD(P)-dependent oxidoreductase n=1 Tax=Quadrisphaera setariae TaxID=2593304 RepID=UPI0021062FD1|nr:SDR family oxidoreductase [Quadrisphaera setariae]
MDLQGARVLVTGATGGLGRPTVARLAGAGARLALTARDSGRLEELAGSLEGDRALAVTADLTLPDQPQAVVDAAVDHLGGLDAVVHLAGASGFSAVGAEDDDVLDELLLVDYLAPVRLLRAALPALRETKGTALVVTAVLAEGPVAGMAAYGAAKAALSSYVGAAAKELRRDGVRVVDARPPHTETGLADRPLTGTAPKLPRGKDPDDVAARLVQALVDDEREVPSSAF